MAPPQSQSTSMERLHHVEKRIVRVLELAAEAMDDLAYTTGPRMDALFAHCREFMQCIKTIQSPELQFFLAKHFGFYYSAVYYKGKENVTANALSCQTTSLCQIEFFEANSN